MNHTHLFLEAYHGGTYSPTELKLQVLFIAKYAIECSTCPHKYA